MRSIIKLCCVAIGVILTFGGSALAQDYFHISTEPRPAQFVQEAPVLFNGPNGEFIIAWRDFRDGLEGYYAQLFDTQASPVGSNFKILSNEQVVFAADGVYASFGHEFFRNPPIELYQGFMQIYSVTGIKPDPVKVTEFWVPGDFVGCPAFGSFLGATEKGYLLGDAFNSGFQLLGFDQTGEQNYAAPDSVLPGYDALGFTMTSNLNGDYAYFWLGMGEDYSFEATELYGRFFDRNHKVVADSVLLFTLRGDPCEVGYTMRATTLTDSLYQLYFAKTDTLWYLTCNADGQLLQSADFKILPRPEVVPGNVMPRTRGFGLSNVVDTTFSVLVFNQYYWFDNGVWQNRHQTAKFDFRTDGRLLQQVLASLTPFENVRNIRKIDAVRLQLPFTQNNDVFLYDLEHLTIVDSVKLNDDTAGANQRNPSVIAAPNETFLVSWVDEKGVKRRLIDAGGALQGEEVTIAFESGLFFPSGEFLAFWKTDSSNVFTLGYRIYSPEWQIVEEAVLARTRRSRWWVNARATARDDDTFVTLLQDSTELHLLKISRTKGVVADSLIVRSENPWPVKVAQTRAGGFWAVWRSDTTWITRVQAFDSNFRSVSPRLRLEHLFGDQIDFAGQDRVASLRLQNFPKEAGLYLMIHNAANGVLISEIWFAPFASYPAQLQTLDDAYFHVNWSHDKTVWAQSFDVLGRPQIGPIAVYTSQKFPALQGTSTVSGAKVLYVWSDAVIQGNGFDILGKTLTVPLVTAVPLQTHNPRQFALHQNYPNPFNPETSIEYEIRQPGKATLTIYNIIGQRVRTLIDMWQAAGRYRTVWDGRDGRGKTLASGVYVYELKTQRGNLRNKMILLR